MHYKNGREAKEGDSIICKGYANQITVGKVHSLLAGTDSCNCTVAEAVMGGVQQLTCRNLKDMYHAEDAYNIIEQASLNIVS